MAPRQIRRLLQSVTAWRCAPMDLSHLPLIGLATKRMAWLARRQEVLAQNVANADTPRYVPTDLKPQDFRTLLHPTAPHVSLVRTDEGENLNGTIPVRRFRDGKEKEPYEEKPSGNAVSLEEQLLKVSQTQTDYNLVSTIYKKQLDLLKMAIGRGAG
jgi:flagellar basal-body rod protein FlgB